MELPFEYIVLSIFNMLDCRNKELIIKRSDLAKYFATLVSILSTDNDDFEDALSSFDYEIELDFFLREYDFYMIDNEDGNIIFNYDYVDELSNMIDEVSLKYDNRILNVIIELMDNNVALIELLGIKINKNLYHILLDNESKIENLYTDLKKCVNPKEREKIIKRIKFNRFQSIMLFNNMERFLDYMECYDLLLYGTEYADSFDKGIFTPITPREEDSSIMDGAIWRTLFDAESLYLFTLRDKMDKLTEYKEDFLKKEDKSELKFYLVYLNLLNREINLTSDYELREEFITAKYRLMNVLDTLYDTTTFMEKIDPIVSFQEDDYDFISGIVFRFIDDILSTSDKEYYKKSKRNRTIKDIVTYYYNVIEKLFVETYYNLTKSENVIATIKENKLYGKNKISSGFFEEMISKTKKKIR